MILINLKKRTKKKQNKKKTFTKNTWYDRCDWLINSKKAGEVNLTPFWLFPKIYLLKRA